MNKEDFDKGLKELMAAFRVSHLSEDTINVYYKYCKHSHATDYWVAVSAIIKTDKFFPTISRIVELLTPDKAVW